MTFRDLTKEEIIQEKMGVEDFDKSDLYKKYNEIQDNIGEFFKLWKGIEKDIDRKEFNELRKLQFDASQNLAQMTDILRTLMTEVK